MAQAGLSRGATLTIQNVDARLKEALRVRAARRGHILRRALAAEQPREPNLAEAIRRRFAPLGGVELEPHPPVLDDEPPSFERR